MGLLLEIHMAWAIMFTSPPKNWAPGRASGRKADCDHGPLGVRVQSPTITLAMSGRGNHTNYSWQLLRVTVRVNAGAT
jgi:hypothetical protein